MPINDIIIMETPTTLKLSDMFDRYIVTDSKDITTHPAIKVDGVMQGKYRHIDELKAENTGGKTFKWQLNLPKFNNDLRYWFKKLYKEVDIPLDSQVHCSMKKLQPLSHQVHTDSDNNYGEHHEVYTRFSIPLTPGSPTTYYDKCMDDDDFNVRVDKTSFRKVGKDNKWQGFEQKHLKDMKTGKEVRLDLPTTEVFREEYMKKMNLMNIPVQQMYGLNIHTIAEWNPGEIQFFPCSNLHSSTDCRGTKFEKNDDGTWYEKYFLTGIIFKPKSGRHQFAYGNTESY
jgi:hypothetical protein|tara:strand:- start:904 stop:1758 length:855 start_codon:yes stop_codon:yes gene_type:complete